MEERQTSVDYIALRLVSVDRVLRLAAVLAFSKRYTSASSSSLARY